MAGDVRRRQRCGSHLIEQWLKAMMILPVDYRHLGRCALQRLGGLQATKTGTDDDDPGMA
jgi:hypothetical protein